MNIKKYKTSHGILSLIGLAMLTSCGTTRKGAEGDIVSIRDINGEWDIKKIGDMMVSPETDSEEGTPYIGFDISTTRIYGYTGCNRLLGNFNLNTKPGSIDFINLGSTRMLCPDMSLEESVMKELNDVRGFRINGQGELNLINRNGASVMLLSKRASEDGNNVLNGSWTVTHIDNMPASEFENGPFKLHFNREEGTFSCDTDCNVINGTYSTEGSEVKFSDLFGTLKVCENMQAEIKMTGALQSAHRYMSISDGSVAFYDMAGGLLFILRPTE